MTLQHDIATIADRPTASLLPLALTPQAWLSLLPAIVAQLEPEQHEEFVIKTLREFDRAGAEIGGCIVDEWW